MTVVLERSPFTPKDTGFKASSEGLMNSLIRGEVLPEGTKSQVYTTSKTAATSWRNDRDELRLRVLSMNTPEYFKTIFFTEGKKENGTLVHKVNELGDGQMSFSQPTSPYAEVGILGMATTNEALDNELPEVNGMIKPLNWTELGDVTRFAYTASQLELLQNLHAHAEDQNRKGHNKKAVIMQNSASVGAPETSQSIFLPHFHATVHNLDNFIDSDEPILRMNEEQTILKDENLANIMLPRLNRMVKSALKANDMSTEGFSIVQREAAPFGFAIAFGDDKPITVDNMTDEKNIKRIMVIKQRIHRGYSLMAKKLAEHADSTKSLSTHYGIKDSKGITEQPSYREIMDIDDQGNLRLIYSPMLESRGGPLEACDVRLDRQKNPAFLDGMDIEMINALHKEHAVNASNEVEKYAAIARNMFREKQYENVLYRAN